MDHTFDVYVVFGVYRSDDKDGRNYVKTPLFVSHSLAQSQYEWQLFETHREWLPAGATYVTCYVAPRTIELYLTG